MIPASPASARIRPMRRFLLLPLFLALSLDFAVLDAPLFPTGPRTAEWDDEEESVPSRVLRLRRTVPPAAEGLPAHRVVAPARTQRRPGARPEGRHRPPEWVIPLTQARVSSSGPASPPEDH